MGEVLLGWRKFATLTIGRGIGIVKHNNCMFQNCTHSPPPCPAKVTTRPSFHPHNLTRTFADTSRNHGEFVLTFSSPSGPRWPAAVYRPCWLDCSITLRRISRRRLASPALSSGSSSSARLLTCGRGWRDRRTSPELMTRWGELVFCGFGMACALGRVGFHVCHARVCCSRGWKLAGESVRAVL